MYNEGQTVLKEILWQLNEKKVNHVQKQRKRNKRPLTTP
ncbi:hypothetical protein LFUMFP_170006 [Latilactobacillus fuchuensis]|uniref:Uncharacterized protein n=1 Tax=Latilactobacillus fuchuensis TaxID=164393 RepID=A0A2N9DU35_9LACO|nr:hypothetical protein LFUMFP_170006 [Latilactobacillus fuchuensis]